SNPRTVLSWLGVISAAVLWIVAGMGGWQLPWWLNIASTLGFLAGAISLFFLLPKTWAHRDRFDDDDYGDGAKDKWPKVSNLTPPTGPSPYLVNQDTSR